MSTSVRQTPNTQGIELGTAVSWPPIVAAIGLVVVLLTVAGTLVLLSPSPTAPAKDQARGKQPLLPSRDQVARLPARPALQSLPAEAVRRPVVANSKPLPATPPPVRPVDVVVAEPSPPKTALSVPVPAVAVAPKPVADASVVPQPTPAPVAAVDEPAPVFFKRRQPYSEETLRDKLVRESREADIEAEKGTSAKLLAALEKTPATSGGERAADEKAAEPLPPVLEVIARRSDLEGLPVRNVADCRVDAKDAARMSAIARLLGCFTNRSRRSIDPDDCRGSPMHADMAVAKQLGEALTRKTKPDEVTVRMAEQMVQADTYPLRHQLIKVLAATKGKNATEALARRAVFDLAPDLRETAVELLKGRAAAEYRPVFLGALRYPWAPVADHAAEALVALRDRQAVADLVDLLDEPNPRAPIRSKDAKWLASELVRINHLGNCLLCHAPSSSFEGPLRGTVPERGKPLPELFYDGEKGPFVRADVTYLRQDFSVMQKVAEPKGWPELQRFDVLVRQREVSAEEAAKWRPAGGTHAEMQAPYPQREAVLWALRELTGEDMGDRSEDWRRVFGALCGGDEL